MQLYLKEGNFYEYSNTDETKNTRKMKDEVVAITRTLPDGSGITLSKLFQINSYTG